LIGEAAVKVRDHRPRDDGAPKPLLPEGYHVIEDAHRRLRELCLLLACSDKALKLVAGGWHLQGEKGFIRCAPDGRGYYLECGEHEALPSICHARGQPHNGIQLWYFCREPRPEVTASIRAAVGLKHRRTLSTEVNKKLAITRYEKEQERAYQEGQKLAQQQRAERDSREMREQCEANGFDYSLMLGFKPNATSRKLARMKKHMDESTARRAAREAAANAETTP
jgi:hypothetical protein